MNPLFPLNNVVHVRSLICGQTCVRGSYLRYISRSVCAPLESCSACTMRSAASSVSITRIRYRCLETCTCSGSQSAVSMCGIFHCYRQVKVLIACAHDVRSINFKYHSCHLASSPRKAGGFSQPGVQDVRRRQLTSCFRCRSPCLLQSLDLRRQLSDSSLVFNSSLCDPSADHGLHVLVLWNHGCVVLLALTI